MRGPKCGDDQKVVELSTPNKHWLGCEGCGHVWFDACYVEGVI
jgi:hypothetical protein